jgi:transposase
MTMVETRLVCGGVDTHSLVHVAAVVDHNGGLLGIEEFETARAGYEKLLDWMRGFGDVMRVGVEGTGSYGVDLARHLAAAGIEVVEVDRPDRVERNRSGKSDPIGRRASRKAATVRSRRCGCCAWPNGRRATSASRGCARSAISGSAPLMTCGFSSKD